MGVMRTHIENGAKMTYLRHWETSGLRDIEKGVINGGT